MPAICFSKISHILYLADQAFALVWKFSLIYLSVRASLVAQLVKDLPAMRETWVWSLGWEDTMEKGKATHSSILAWRIPWTVQSMGSQRVGHDWATFTSLHFTLNNIWSQPVTLERLETLFKQQWGVLSGIKWNLAGVALAFWN